MAVAPHQPEPIRILHLSDLHLGPNDDPAGATATSGQRFTGSQTGGLGFDHVDYLVVSGDLTNRASVEEFEKVYQFISALIARLKITAARCVIVPGNHDLSWDHEVYDWRPETPGRGGQTATQAATLEQGDGAFWCGTRQRLTRGLRHFGKFYHALTRKSPTRLKAGVTVPGACSSRKPGSNFWP